jgi:hypothetical protein
MEHPKTVGERSQLAIIVALDRVGYPVFVPLGKNTRYDFVIDEGKNGQQDRIRHAADYEIAQVWIDASAGPGGRPGAGGSCA